MFSSNVQTSFNAHISQNASPQEINERAIFTFSPFITPSFSLGKGQVWDDVCASACNPWTRTMCELCSLFRTAAAEKCRVPGFGRVGWEVRSNTNKAWLWSWRLWKQEKGRGKSRGVKAERVIASGGKRVHFNRVGFCFGLTSLFCQARNTVLFKEFIFLCVPLTVSGELTQSMTSKVLMLTTDRFGRRERLNVVHPKLSPSSSVTSQFSRPNLKTHRFRQAF